jgi:hypothetical protein
MKFRVVFLVEAEVELSEELVKEALTPDWASHFYRLNNPCGVAHHVAYNLICNRADLRQLDGFAEFDPKKDARLLTEEWTLDEVGEI